MRGLIVAIALTLLGSAAKADDAHRCLSEALYFEARDQGWFGLLAGGVVIQNRVRSDKYPNTVCAVVRQGRYWGGTPVRDRCQFSYWCDGKPEEPETEAAWLECQNIAKLLLSTRIEIEGLEGATHYHATWMTPKWVNLVERKQRIGGHIFYALK